MTTYTPELDKLIAIATGEVGYHEGRKNGQWDNIEKYAAQVPGLAWANGQPWCDVFVAWVFKQADLESLIPVSASCNASRDGWRKQGRYSEYPAIGAQILYGTPSNAEHTGIVIGYDATYVTTIEGNTNDNGSAEGDGVYRHVHLRTSGWVQGYGVPKFPGGVISADPKFAKEKPVPAKPAPSGPTRVSQFFDEYAKKGVIDLNLLEEAEKSGRTGHVAKAIDALRSDVSALKKATGGR